MKIFSFITLVFCLVACPLSADTEHQDALTKQTLTILNAYHKLKIGMTRAQFLTQIRPDFTPAGGISTIAQQTFVYKGTSYILFDVEFKIKPGQTEEDPTDTVRTISKLYLDYGHAD